MHKNVINIWAYYSIIWQKHWQQQESANQIISTKKQVIKEAICES